MSYAALVSGIMLSHSGLGAVHGIAGPLGGLFPVPHGVACGKLLFPVMTFVVKKIIDENNLVAQKRFADIGRILTGDAGGEDIFFCKRFLDVLNTWTRTLKLPQLSYFGMTAADMAKAILLSDSKNSPAILSKEEMKTILEVVR
jgi:alcohol dehydrogenase class IV